MIKSVGKINGPSDTGGAESQSALAENGLSQAEVLPVKKARRASTSTNTARPLSKDSPLAGAVVLQPVSACGAADRPDSPIQKSVGADF
jgi:hypothetical protein